ncbi:ParB/RepB/Spo0J family partition protein [Hornefia butyriciproducens]|uniref:ParB/RepB/Spo0J family partition protein n=1 Tax=Hornefia butyriciproducens TaxID=2652293 RepID=UPI002A911446|nr:ParB/RepB/Spo0J family partition protein [Hornefia butyriciproducens]MDY5463199.1 ParB/RepB/Spo0J family partition protein [Hornefia butyriciproducens]
MEKIGTVHMLDTDKLIPNPDNPRKDVGDIEELAKSIRKNGIMQNLTVVPADENLEEFMVLIGHRRLAAAKAAGLVKVPCVIAAGLTREEQLAIMLEENMQRNDLTVLEQAESFQMMIDLGNTVESLTEKTGFSESTIRHRLKIAELDSEMLRKREEDPDLQLSLTDLYELEKIKSLETRNSVLGAAISGDDLRRRARNAAAQEKLDEAFERCAAIMQQAGLKPAGKEVKSWSAGLERVWSDELNNPELIRMLKDKLEELDPETKYIYLRDYGRIFIMTKKKPQKHEMTEEEKRRKELDKRRKAFVEIQKAYDRRRHDFILNELQGSKLTEEQKQEIMTRAIEILLRYGQGTSITKDSIAAYVEEIERWKTTEAQKEAALNMEPWVVMLAAADYDMSLYSGMYRVLIQYNGEINTERAEEIKEIYNLLTKYGYEMEPEEKAMLDGTHELYGEG